MQTRTNSESAHDLDFPGAAVDDVGKRHYAALLSSRPTGSFRATPPPRLLHHIPGRAPDMIRRLVKKGLLQRRRRREDARAYVVRLSDGGRAALKSAQSKAARADGVLLARLSGEQRKALVEALSTISVGE